MRKLLAPAAFGLTAVALSVGVAVTAANQEPKGKHDAHAAHFIECAKACHSCALLCDTCATHCTNLIAAGHKEHVATLQTCQDCSSVCASAANITAKAGPFSDLICKACADACKRCGDACAKFPNDEHMKKCADECYKCEKACREMLTHIGK
jgi:hypothetical protein